MKEAYTIPEKVKFIRQELNLSVRELSELIRVSITSIRHYESGLRNPSQKVLRRLSKASGLSEHVLKDNNSGISKLNTLKTNQRLNVLDYMNGEKYATSKTQVVKDMLNDNILITSIIPIWDKMSDSERANIIVVFLTSDD